jgi:hypothetical protein
MRGSIIWKKMLVLIEHHGQEVRLRIETGHKRMCHPMVMCLSFHPYYVTTETISANVSHPPPCRASIKNPKRANLLGNVWRGKARVRNQTCGSEELERIHFLGEIR